MLFGACTAALVGALLPLRCNVFMLIPTTIFALFITAVVGAVEKLPMMSIFVEMLVVSAALQIGYLVGRFREFKSFGLPSQRMRQRPNGSQNVLRFVAGERQFWRRPSRSAQSPPT